MPNKVSLRQYATNEYSRQSYNNVLTTLEMSLNRSADGFLTPVRRLSANTTLNTNDNIVLVDSTVAAITITLPIALESEQKTIIIKKIDSSVNAVTVAAQGTSTIDGVASRSISAQYGTLRLTAFAGNWHLV